MSDTPVRSLIKTLSWRLTGSLSTFVIAYIISGNIQIAIAVAALHVIVNTILYYLHERVWNKVGWGKTAK